MHNCRRIILLGVLAGCGAEDGDPADVEPPTDRVESYKHGQYYEMAFTRSGDLEWATGAVLVPFLDNNGEQKTQAGHNIRGTCGITFVTPSHAITAAHCVEEQDVPDPANQTLWVEMYNVSASFNWTAYDSLTGTFPQFSSPMTSIGLAEGYEIDAYPCELVARCGTDWGPLIECTETEADIALLECQGEPGNTYGYVDVPEQDAANGETAIMPWKHEVYDADPSDPEHFAHYVDWYQGGPHLNFHYFEEGKLLPLRAIGQWVGDLFFSPRILGYSGMYPVRWTTLMGCHGTSGSGIGRKNLTTGHEELLGPVALGQQMAGLLCHPTSADPLAPAMGYTRREYTYDLARRAECGDFGGSLLLWLWCHRDRFYEEEMKFPDFGFDWPMLEGFPIERWRVTNEPAAEYPLGRRQLDIPFRSIAEGTETRISVHAVALDGPVDRPVQLWYGEEPLDEVHLGRHHSAKLTAVVVGDGRSEISVRYDGERPIGLTELTMAPAGEVNGFDTMAQRAGIGMLDDEGALQPMRFVRFGEQGFAAKLQPGETMAITRQAFVRGAEGWTLRMRVEGEADRLDVHAYDAFGEEPIPMETRLERGVLVAEVSGVDHPVAMTITAPAEGEALLLDDAAIDAW